MCLQNLWVIMKMIFCEVEGVMLWVASIDAWIAMFVTDLTKEKKGDHRQRRYADTYDYMLVPAVKQLKGNVSGFVEYQVSEEVQVARPRECTEVVDSRSKPRKYIRLKPG